MTERNQQQIQRMRRSFRKLVKTEYCQRLGLNIPFNTISSWISWEGQSQATTTLWTPNLRTGVTYVVEWDVGLYHTSTMVLKWKFERQATWSDLQKSRIWSCNAFTAFFKQSKPSHSPIAHAEHRTFLKCSMFQKVPSRVQVQKVFETSIVPKRPTFG